MPRDPASLPASIRLAYQENLPFAPLRNGLTCTWTYQAPMGPVSSEVLVIPDGCVDLIWSDGELFVAGPDPVAVPARIAPGAQLVAVRFAPGAALQFVGASLQAIAGQRVPLRDLWGRRAGRFTDALSVASTRPCDRIARLQHVIAQYGPPEPDPAMHWLFTQLDVAAAPSPAQLARELGLGERTLRRRCHEAFGYGPKTLARIQRLQRFLSASGHSALLLRALEAGYGDASHLVRETRLLTGLTPRALLAQRHG